MINCFANTISEKKHRYNLQEKSLYKNWLFQTFPQEKLTTVCGKSVSILDPGKRNLYEGPDFLAAKMFIDDKLLRGDVEIHVRNSDWNAHQHQNDPVYNNVILHVVVDNSSVKKVRTQDGKLIPVFILPVENDPVAVKPPCHQWKGIAVVPAQKKLGEFADIRFQRKGVAIKKAIIEKSANHVFYRLILDGLGYSQNRESFKTMAEYLPLSRLYSILGQVDSDSAIITLETVLLGTAGFIEGPYSKYIRPDTKYYSGIVKHWKMLQRRFDLPVKTLNWHFAGIRPANYPGRRLIALAQILDKFYPNEPAQLWINLLSTHAGLNPILEWLTEYFQQPSGMWRNHPLLRNFRSNVLVGHGRVMDLLSNLFLPFGWAAGMLQNNSDLTKRSVMLSREAARGEIPAFIKRWSEQIELNKGFFNRNYLIQGTIELRHSFCDIDLCKLCPLEEYAY